MNAAWSAQDLAFTTAVFVEAAASSYGKYSPRNDSSFAASDVITVYAEPIGYDFAPSADGFRYDLEVGFRLLNTTGQVLAEQNGFASFSGEARTMRKELGTSLSFQFEGLPAGSYILSADFTDKIGEKSASLSLPLTIVSAD